ncbi:MAG TPA: hypothetical protein VFG07_07240 [Thermoplasmata archaeon]|nr:hypothetical protein [Thermoplasmata archaeon]
MDGALSQKRRTANKEGKPSELQTKIAELHGILAVASENGLFAKGAAGERHFAALKTSLERASVLSDGEVPSEHEAYSALQDFYKELSEAQNEAGFGWRFVQLYAVPAWIYLVLTPLAVYFIQNWYHLLPSSPILEASIWGLLGGCLQGFYWIWQQVSRGQFRAQWAFWVLSLPPGGLIFGAIAYLVVTGGLLSLFTTSPPAINETSAFLFSALAGFSWKDFARLLKQFWDRLGTEPAKGQATK